MSYGVLYVATGAKHARLALLSASSLQRVMPDCPIAFVVDDAKLIQESGISYDQILVLENPLYGYEDKLSGMMLAPYEHTLFLDADTYVVRPIPELFQLLDRFDIAAKHNSRRRAAFLEDVPDSFPEYNTGVVAYRRSPEVRAFFQLWLDTYHMQMDESWTHHYRTTRCDEPAFRDALYKSDLRIATLGDEYNCQVSIGLLGDYVKILHHHGITEDLDKTEQILNFDPGRRVFFDDNRRLKRLRARARGLTYVVATRTRKPSVIRQIRISIGKRGVLQTLTHSFNWIMKRLKLKTEY
jgi:hypothetical protein